MALLGSAATHMRAVSLPCVTLWRRIVPDVWDLVPNDPFGERLLMEAAAKHGNLDEVTTAITNHRASFVNESDFQLMSKNGINAVRMRHRSASATQ